jgi:ADP-heptose:LPS heptosyltransferase
MGYGDDGIMRGMRSRLNIDSSTFDLPDFELPMRRLEGINSAKYAVIRPATVRKEWMAASRNPKPEYLAECAQILLDNGFDVISVADLEDGAEWALNPLPPATIRFHKGELSIKELLGLVSHAKIVVGGIGWLTPAAIAYKVPAWFIFGGFGKYNAPSNLFDSGRMNLSKVGYAIPDNFCRCSDGQHNCKKEIKDHAKKFTEWLGRFPDLVS